MTAMHPPINRPRVVRDTLTMLERNLLHNLRMPMGFLIVVLIPLIFLLLFVFVFGETLGAGLFPGGTREQYLTYIVPAILVMAAASASQMIAVWIAMDMKEGIISRFRTMPIAPSSVLAGHVYGGIGMIVLSTLSLLGIAFALGFRPHATGTDWLTLAVLLLMMALAFAWLSVGFGLAASGPDTASNLTMILMMLPFLSGGFVPLDSLPGPLRWFATNQPFTPMIDSIRGLLSTQPVNDLSLAFGWSLVLALIGFGWSMWLYKRRSGERHA